MGYEVKEARTYPGTPEAVRAAAAEVVAALGGKPARKAAAGSVDATFNKGVGAKVLMNRVQLQVHLAQAAPGQCAAAVQAFPIDPVGQKLLFGVMGQPAQEVVTAFWAALEAKLGSPAG